MIRKRQKIIRFFFSLPRAAIALAAPPDSSTVFRLRLHASLISAPSGRAVTFESRNDRGRPLELLLFGERAAGEEEEEEDAGLKAAESAEVEAEAIEAGIDVTRSSAPPLRRSASLGIASRTRRALQPGLAGGKRVFERERKENRLSNAPALFL